MTHISLARVNNASDQVFNSRQEGEGKFDLAFVFPIGRGQSRVVHL